MRVLIVTGGRTLGMHLGRPALLEILYASHAISEAWRELGATHMYVGDALGADKIARAWASVRCIPVTVFVADWQRHGKAAGPIRNEEMIVTAYSEADEGAAGARLLALPGGAGTENCVRNANKYGIPVWRKSFKEDMRALGDRWDSGERRYFTGSNESTNRNR